MLYHFYFFFFFSSRRRHTRCGRDWSSDVCFPILGLAELYRAGSRSPEHADLLAQLDRHRGLAEYVGDRVIEARACHDRECLKYCPERECRTVTDITDPDLWCWTC